MTTCLVLIILALVRASSGSGEVACCWPALRTFIAETLVAFNLPILPGGSWPFRGAHPPKDHLIGSLYAAVVADLILELGEGVGDDDVDVGDS